MAFSIMVGSCKSRFSERSMTLVQKKPVAPTIQFSSSFIGYRDINGTSNNYIKHIQQGAEVPSFIKEGKTGENVQELVKEDNIGRVAQKALSSALPQSSQDRKDSESEATFFDDEYLHLMGGDDEIVDKSSIESMKRQATMRSANSIRKTLGVQMSNGRLRHVKSELHDSSGRNGFFGNSYSTEKATKIRSADVAGTSIRR